jgi:hypothetical protein
MLKKLLSLLSIGLMLGAGAHAQYFTIEDKLVEETTTGTALKTDDDYPTIDMHTNLVNATANAFPIKWQLITDSTSHPLGWLVAGICDNIQCRTPYSPFYYGTVQESLPFPGVTPKCLIEARIYAPTVAANGTGTVKVRVWSFDATDTSIVTQADTITFKLTKGPVGISSIEMNDSRVSLYPNPATNNLTVYTDKSLNAAKLSVYSIIGRQQFAVSLEKGKEVNNIDINRLAPGIYMMRLTDAQGNTVTTRKFTKK